MNGYGKHTRLHHNFRAIFDYKIFIKKTMIERIEHKRNIIHSESNLNSSYECKF